MRKKPIALITGANKGLGKEVSRQLGGLGMRVYLGSRDDEHGQAAADDLAKEGADVMAIALDVTDETSIVAAARQIENREGLLDVLVNNAGVLYRVPALETDAANMLATYDVNVFGTVRTIRAFLPLLQQSPAPRRQHSHVPEDDRHARRRRTLPDRFLTRPAPPLQKSVLQTLRSKKLRLARRSPNIHLSAIPEQTGALGGRG